MRRPRFAAIQAIQAERDQLRAEVERLKDGGVQRIKDTLATTLDARDAAIARAARAEADLAAERAIVSRIWTQLGSPTYEQLKGRSIYDLIDELKAELAAEREKCDKLLSVLIHADLILDDIDTCSDAHKPMYSSYSQNVFKLCVKGRDDRRAAIDAAMKEQATKDHAHAEADTARLNWLEANPEAIAASSVHKSTFGRKVWWRGGEGDYDTARAAIDAGMREAAK